MAGGEVSVDVDVCSTCSCCCGGAELGGAVSEERSVSAAV